MTGNELWLNSARRIAPFAAACLLAWITVLVGSRITWWEYWTGFVLAWTAGGLALVAIVDGRHPWLAVVPSSLCLLAAVAFLRDSAGGLASGASALAILPVLQTALYSRSRRDLGVVLLALALFFLVPIWLVGGQAYPQTQYRTVVLAVAADAIIGLTTQGLVEHIRKQARESRARERMLQQVSVVVHGLFDRPQPRQDVCEAAMEISDATSAVLLEAPTSSGQLRCTAAAGPWTEVDDDLIPRHSVAYEAMRTGRPVLLTENVEARVGLREVWIAAGSPGSLLYQPLMHGGRPLGVLVIGWPNRVSADGPGATVAALLAHEAAAVISRADTLDHLNDEVLTDELTGLPNRRAWEQRIQELSGADRTIAIAMLDLDHFKEFNDTFGHPAGDRLLRETAAKWRDQLRSGDLLARLGGEEFGLLLLDCDTGAAGDVVDRLRRSVTHGRSCSAGIAARGPGEALHRTTERADAALYRAKAAGRDQAVLADGHSPTGEARPPSTSTS